MNKLPLLLLLSTGCAIGPGEPFATITSAMEVKLDVPAGRAIPGGFYKLSTSHEVTFTRFDLYFSEARLVDLGDTQSAQFDPENPPPGYTVCHNGHCDREDGALVSYEEVAASISGGGGSSDVVHLTVGKVDMLSSMRLELSCEEGCDLPASTTDLIKLGVERVDIRGIVRLPPATNEVPFILDFAPATTVELTAQQDIDVTRYGSTKVDLTLRPRIGPAILDGVQFSAAQPSAEAKGIVSENLAASTLDVEVKR